jgi:hypothetical protein
MSESIDDILHNALGEIAVEQLNIMYRHVLEIVREDSGFQALLVNEEPNFLFNKCKEALTEKLLYREHQNNLAERPLQRATRRCKYPTCRSQLPCS